VPGRGGNLTGEDIPVITIPQLLAQSAGAGFESPAWSPYGVGAGLGVLSWLTLYVARNSLGASGGYASLAGLIVKRLAPGRVRSLPYYRDHPPSAGWGLALLAGMLAGAALAAWTGGEITNRLLPEMWRSRFGPDSGGLRIGTAFAGGVLMAFGARWAGGCTSGHGISGTLKLSVGSWIAAAGFFAGGIPVAFLLHRP
jgi:uncharacterized membrane protein YedE/YeeE